MVRFNLKNGFVIAAVAMLLLSCNPGYYQVFEVKSDVMKLNGNSWVYENEDLEIMYNLWSNGGEMNFIVNNKTDRDVFVDLGRSFFISNSHARDYFQNREYTSTVAVSSSLDIVGSKTYLSSEGFWPNSYLVPTSQSLVGKLTKGASRAVHYKEKEVICIPAHSFKVINGCSLSPSHFMTCIKYQDYPKHSESVASYTKTDTPEKYCNRISYSFNKDCSDSRQISNDFYLANITNYSKKEALEKVKMQYGCSKSESSTSYYFKIGGPNKYYLVYRGK